MVNVWLFELLKFDIEIYLLNDQWFLEKFK